MMLGSVDSIVVLSIMVVGSGTMTFAMLLIEMIENIASFLLS